MDMDTWTIIVNWPRGKGYEIDLVSPRGNAYRVAADAEGVIGVIDDLVTESGYKYFRPHYCHTVEYQVPAEQLLTKALGAAVTTS